MATAKSRLPFDDKIKAAQIAANAMKLFISFSSVILRRYLVLLLVVHLAFSFFSRFISRSSRLSFELHTNCHAIQAIMTASRNTDANQGSRKTLNIVYIVATIHTTT